MRHTLLVLNFFKEYCGFKVKIWVFYSIKWNHESKILFKIDSGETWEFSSLEPIPIKNEFEMNSELF